MSFSCFKVSYDVCLFWVFFLTDSRSHSIFQPAHIYFDLFLPAYLPRTVTHIRTHALSLSLSWYLGCRAGPPWNACEYRGRSLPASFPPTLRVSSSALNSTASLNEKYNFSSKTRLTSYGFTSSIFTHNHFLSLSLSSPPLTNNNIIDVLLLPRDQSAGAKYSLNRKQWRQTDRYTGQSSWRACFTLFPHIFYTYGTSTKTRDYINKGIT